MNIIILVPPAEEPVTLAQVWEHLRLTPDLDSPPSHPDDAMLTRQIAAARQDCENKTRRAFVKQKLRLTIDPRDRRWPWYRYWFDRCGAASVELKKPPVVEVVGISYYDSENVLTEVDGANYFVVDSEPARIQFASGFSIGDAYQRSDALRIDYWAGYPFNDSPEDLTSKVPEPIKAAILLGVELQYDSVSTEQRAALERAQDSLLANYVVQIAI